MLEHTSLPIISYQELADILGTNYEAVKKLALRNTVNGSSGEISVDETLVAYVQKRGKYEEFIAYAGKTIVHEKRVERGTTEFQIRECINTRYLEYVTHYEALVPKYGKFTAIDYAKAAALIVWFKRARYTAKCEAYNILCELAAQGVYVLPGSGKSLAEGKKQAIQNWFFNHKEERELINKNAGNSYASEFGSQPDIMGWSIDLLADARNLPVPAVRRMLDERCRWFGYNVPSESWLKKLRKEWEATIAEYRWDDRNPHKQAYRIYIPTAKAPHAGTVWTIDGTQYNNVPHETAEGKQARLYYMCVRDEFSGDAFSIMPCYSEGVEVVIATVKSAIAEAGYLPYEIRHDRFTGHNGQLWKAFSEKLTQEYGVKFTVTPSSWAKGRHERMYETLQSVFGSFEAYNYRDSPLSTRKTARVRNTVILQQEKQAKKQGYDWQAAVADLTQLIAAYRHTPYKEWSKKYKNCEKSPAELHYLSEKPYIRKLEAHELAKLTWERRDEKPYHGYIQYRENYITYRYKLTPEIMYDINPDTVTIYCDREEPEHIYVYDFKSGEYLGCLQRQEDVLTAGPDADWQALAEAKKFKKGMAEYAHEKFKKVVDAGAKQYIDEETGEVIPITAADEAGSLLGGRETKERVAAAEEALLNNLKKEKAPKPTKQVKSVPQVSVKKEPEINSTDDDDDEDNFFIKMYKKSKNNNSI